MPHLFRSSKVRIYTSAIAILGASFLCCSAQTIVTATLSPANAGATISSDYLGLSIEMNNVITTGSNHPVFSGTSTVLSNLLRQIGVKSLRIGGNATEATPYPSSLDSQNVIDFAQLTGTNLIWSLPASTNYNLTTYGSYAGNMYNWMQFKHDTFAYTFEIGNEPDLIGISQATYQARFDAYTSYLRTYCNPTITTTGPGAGANESYATALATDSTYAGSQHADIGFITVHNYPAGGPTTYPTASAAMAAMLSSGINATYDSFWNKWADTVVANNFRPRMEEVNSFYSGGVNGVSNSFGAALWSMDYLSYFAQHYPLAGMNFHTGGSSSYNVFSPTTYSTTYTLNGVGYGMFAFSYAGQGRTVPVSLSNPSNVNLTAYSTLLADGSESMHIVNRTYGSSAIDATMHISAGNGYTHAEYMYLKQASSDVTSNTGITLGGQPVNTNATWTGGYTNFATASGGIFTIPAPHAQGVIIRFYP